MPFVKLDCGMLDSTLWIDRSAREVFITALLMAEPYELLEPSPQLAVRSLEETGWVIPAGWYGFVRAAGVGILHRAMVEIEAGYAALEVLGSPEVTSRSPKWDGRRLVRISGGYLVLNFMDYRDRDYTAAARSKRYRERVASRRSVTASHRDITQAEAEAEAEKIKSDTAPRADRETTAGMGGVGNPARASSHQSTNVNPHAKPTNLVNGHSQRLHGTHAWCNIERGICVPFQLHQEMRGRAMKTDAEMIAWYAATVDKYTAPFGDDTFTFWRNELGHWLGLATSRPTPKKLTNEELLAQHRAKKARESA